jgi:predicted ATPase
MIERKIAQLSDEDRQLLVCAAVQGHTFDSAVVAKVLERDPAETEERLEILDRVYAFIRVQGEVTLPDGTAAVRCRFVHVLYQNALYALVRATRRSSLSAMVANALIEFHGSENTSIAAELAVLLEVARDQRAARYLLLASQNALRVFAFVEAAAIANRGLALLLTQPDTRDRNALELKLQLALGTAFVAIKGNSAPEVERAYGRARDLCHQVGDSVELASVLFGLVVHYAVVASHATSLSLGDELLALADRENQADARVQGLLTHGITRAWMGDVEEAVARLEQGITLYDARRPSFSGATPLFDYGVGCRRYQAVALWHLGYPERAVSRAEEAVADARRLKHPHTLASTLTFVSLLHYFRRDIPASLDAAAEASACAREYVLTFWLGISNALHGWGVAHLADASGRPSEWDEGVAQIRENLEALRGAGARSFGSVGQALLAETYMLRERFDEAASALDEGLDLAAQVREGLWEAELHRLRGELSLRRGSEAEAVLHFDRAIATARNRKQRSLELRALISLCRLVRSQADLKEIDRVRMQLAQTSDSFTEGFDTPDLVEARALVVRP